MVPQDGRFKIQVQEEKLSFRVSIIRFMTAKKLSCGFCLRPKTAYADQLGFLPDQNLP